MSLHKLPLDDMLFYGCQQTSRIILAGCLATLLDRIVWVYLNELVTWLLSINQLWFIILLVWTLSYHHVLRIKPLKWGEAQVFRGSLKLLMLLLLYLWFESWWFVGFPLTWMTWMFCQETPKAKLIFVCIQESFMFVVRCVLAHMNASVILPFSLYIKTFPFFWKTIFNTHNF